MFAKLETRTDPDRCAIQDYKNINNASYCQNVGYLMMLYALSPHTVR